MSNLPPTSMTNTLDQQLLVLQKLAERTRQLFRKNEITLPTQLLTNLDQLATGLVALSQQAARRKEEHEKLLALAEIGQVVNSSLELDEVLRIVMDTIVRLTGAERGFLMLRDGGGKLVTRIARNWEKESIAPSEFAISRTIVNQVANQGIPVLTTNAKQDPRYDSQESVISFNLRSILCVPLKLKDELIGVIYTDNRIRSGIFSENELNLLMAFANQAAVAIDNARLFESVRRTLDEVTTLKNLMDNVFASIASGVITTDMQDIITLCNRAAQTILGNVENELIGHNIGDVLPLKDSELAQQMAYVREFQESVTGLELAPTLPRRGRVNLSLNLSPLRHASQGVAIVVDDLTEKKRLEAQRRLFERMVSPAVIRQLDPDKLQLGGKRTSITVLFADIRGFTSFSESTDPERLMRVLNDYLAAAADAVLAQEGTIDKFMGDAVMAWFNAPIPQPDHALRAVHAALGIQKAIRELQYTLPSKFQLSFGAGIHFGDAVLGLVGTEKRLDYTAIGDSVNTAKRIQENAAGGQVLISGAVHKLVSSHFKTRPVAPVRAKGKRLPVLVYEVTGLKD